MERCLDSSCFRDLVPHSLAIKAATANFATSHGAALQPTCDGALAVPGVTRGCFSAGLTTMLIITQLHLLLFVFTSHCHAGFIWSIYRLISNSTVTAMSEPMMSAGTRQLAAWALLLSALAASAAAQGEALQHGSEHIVAFVLWQIVRPASPHTVSGGCSCLLLPVRALHQQHHVALNDIK